MNEHDALSRRNLARVVAGGVIAGAGGLLLPGTIDDAAAREGALGGRHGKNHRGRNQRKRRDHRKEQRDHSGNQDNLPGRGLFRNTALTTSIIHSIDYPFAFTTTYFYRIKTGLDDYGPWKEATTGTAESSRYAPDRFRVGVLVSARGWPGDGQDLFVDLRNLAFATPRGAAYVGTGLDPARNQLGSALFAERAFGFYTTPSGTYGDEVVESYLLKKNPPYPDWTAIVSVTRKFDSDDFIEFAVEVVANG
ncbi:MAG: hypothetical protein U0075_05920 [Thermomicrobiales bacterium]